MFSIRFNISLPKLFLGNISIFLLILSFLNDNFSYLLMVYGNTIDLCSAILSNSLAELCLYSNYLFVDVLKWFYWRQLYCLQLKVCFFFLWGLVPVSPECDSLACRLFWVENNESPTNSGRVVPFFFFLPPPYLPNGIHSGKPASGRKT